MAVGIEERMVPHMENKKQDCKKIEELKRQYAGSEMSGEQVEQMKKRMQQAKQDFTMREMSGIIMRTEKLQVM